jgi:hypothetical protein
MSIESPFEKPPNEEKKPIFEVKKKIGKFDVLVELGQDKEPIRGGVDFETKKANIKITPEGVTKGIKAVNEFLKNPKNQERLEKFNNRLEDWLKKKKEQRGKEKAEEIIKDYAKQEGKEEIEIVEELLDELGGNKED